jgi:phosphoglycolate phosphatase-like HAD superfamily hydrolase
MLWEPRNSGKQVFILDIDGTLMPSSEIDNTCFWQAVFACFEKQSGLPDLHDFKHVTDSGILEEWCRLELGRLPGKRETGRIKQLFYQLLETVSIHQPWHFEPLPGVLNWLETIAKENNVYAGIATGGWEHSARLKLKLAGLDRFKLPLASSDDALSRTEIMRIAAQRTLKYPTSEDAVFTYVGDGKWDLQASLELGWEFIGIASGEQAARLKEAGAKHIQMDFHKKTP